MSHYYKYHPGWYTVGGGGILRHPVIKVSIGEPQYWGGENEGGVIAVVCEQVCVVTRPQRGVRYSLSCMAVVVWP